MKDSRFKKAISDLQKVSMTSLEKKSMVDNIFATQPLKQSANSRPVESPWTIYSFSQFIQSHRWTSAIVVLLIVAISGNSIVLAANESLPGDRFYPIKVSITEPVRVATAVGPEKKAEVQALIVQTRFEEAETLAARGKLDDSKEKVISDLIDQHVEDISKNVEKIEKISVEKAEDINITVQAGMNAHAKILSTINSSRVEKSRSSNISRIASKAREDSKKFEIVREVANPVGALEPSATMMMSAPVPEDASSEMTSSAKIKIESKKDNKPDSNTQSDARIEQIELKKQKIEKEIYEKAREKLKKEQKTSELKKSARKSVNKDSNNKELNKNNSNSDKDD